MAEHSYRFTTNLDINLEYGTVLQFQANNFMNKHSMNPSIILLGLATLLAPHSAVAQESRESDSKQQQNPTPSEFTLKIVPSATSFLCGQAVVAEATLAFGREIETDVDRFNLKDGNITVECRRTDDIKQAWESFRLQMMMPHLDPIVHKVRPGATSSREIVIVRGPRGKNRIMLPFFKGTYEIRVRYVVRESHGELVSAASKFDVVDLPHDDRLLVDKYFKNLKEKDFLFLAPFNLNLDLNPQDYWVAASRLVADAEPRTSALWPWAELYMALEDLRGIPKRGLDREARDHHGALARVDKLLKIDKLDPQIYRAARNIQKACLLEVGRENNK